MKVLYNNEADTVTIDLQKSFRLARNFALEELANTSGDPKEPQYIITKYSTAFNKMLQQFRDKYAASINPTSGYRQPAYNANLKGADSNSLHLRACAVDFIDMKNEPVYFMINTWIQVLSDNDVIGAINIYNEGIRKRYHLEAFSDVFNKRTQTEIRVYSTRAEYNSLKAFYNGFNVGVNYYGS